MTAMNITKLRKNRSLFHEDVWTPLAVFALPAFIYKSDQLLLTPTELAVYALGCEIAGEPKNNCRFTLSVTQIQASTGFSKRNTVTKALHGLVTKNFIKPVGARKPGSKTPQTYELTNPVTQDGFSLDPNDKRERQNFRSALYHSGFGYFNVAEFSLRGLPEFGAGALALFVAAARCANTTESNLRQFNTRQLVDGRYSGRDFEMPALELRRMAGLDRKTFKKMIARIHNQLLHIGFTDATSRTVQVILIDPGTKTFLDTMQDRQQEADEEARKKYRSENRKHTAAQLLAWVMWSFKDCAPRSASGGEFCFWCPKCHNTKTRKGKREQKQRLSVNPFKGASGLYRCYDCMTGGTVKALVTGRMGIFEAHVKLAGIKEDSQYYRPAQELLKNYNEEGECMQR
jgi:hypothetical protein